MPFIEHRNLGPTRAQQPLYEPPTVEVSFGEAFQAGLEQENSLVSAAASGFGGPQFEDDPDFDVFAAPELMQGYEADAKAFVNAKSREEVAWIKAEIDRERENRRTLDDAGWYGVAAQMAAGALDPIYLPALAVRTLTVPRAIIAGLTTEAAAEVAKSATQYTRTPEETALNIMAAGVFSGVFAGVAQALRPSGADVRALESELAKHLDAAQQTPDIVPTRLAGEADSVGAMRAPIADIDDLAPVATGTRFERLGLTPFLRTLKSSSEAARRLAVNLVETPFELRVNRGGGTGLDGVGAVETRLKLHQANLGTALDELKRIHYKGYREAAAGQPGRLSSGQFREEVARAMRRGDEHAIPQVAAAAKSMRAQVFDPLKKEAQALGLLPDDAALSAAIGRTADSYLTRMYNREMIRARYADFRGILDGWLVRTGADPNESGAIAEQIIDSILGLTPGKTGLLLDLPDDVVAKAGVLKERTLLIPDELIEEFLENDIDMISRYYTRTLGPEVELTARFGDRDLAGWMEDVRSEYSDLRAAAPDNATASRLAKEQDAVERDLVRLRDRIIGTAGIAENPDSFWVRAGQAMRQYNFVGLLGSMTVSAIPDIARPVMQHGLRAWAKGLTNIATSWGTTRIARQQLKAAGVGLEMVLNTRATSLAELTDLYARRTLFERGLRAASDQFSVWTLMAPWNNALKSFAGIVASDEFLRIATKAARGGATQKEVAKLARAGIDDDMARVIGAAFDQFGDVTDGVRLPNAHLWPREAREAYLAAIAKDVDSVIITPGAADRPTFMDHEFGKLAGQFKSFAFAANNRLMISGLQQRDMAAASGALMMVTLGMASHAIRENLKGKEVELDPAKLLVEGVDRSGITGLLFDVNNTLGKIGGPSIQKMLGTESKRYASRGAIGALFGPSVDRLDDLIHLAGEYGGAVTGEGEITAKTIERTRKLLPFQNLFYLRAILDAGGAQEALIDALGVPVK